MGVIAKDPSSTVDYGFDFVEWLNSGEAVASALWSVFPVEEGGLGASEAEINGSVVGVWAFSGIAGHTYSLTCEITTNQNRTTQRSLTIRVQER